jgi:hypothetical protein
VHRSDGLVEQEVGEDYDVDVVGGAEDSETEFGFGGVRAVFEWVVGGRCEPFVRGIGELGIYLVFFFWREKAIRKDKNLRLDHAPRRFPTYRSGRR